jgi:hypothetical protein
MTFFKKVRTSHTTPTVKRSVARVLYVENTAGPPVHVLFSKKAVITIALIITTRYASSAGNKKNPDKCRVFLAVEGGVEPPRGS